MEGFRLELYDCCEISIGNTDFRIFFISNMFSESQEWNSPQHFHLFCECHYLKEGEILVETDAQRIAIRAECLCALPANLKHKITAAGHVRRISFYVTISRNKESENDTFSAYSGLFKTQVPIVCEGVNEGFQYMLGLLQKGTAGFLFETKIKHLFALALTEMLEKCNGEQDFQKSGNSMEYGEQTKLKIEDILLNTFSMKQDLQLEDLARHLCLSPRQTSRLVKNLFNRSFRDVKNERYMEEAKRLMADSAYSLREIAELLGYGSYNGFYKAFRLYAGISPEEYRESL
ncbi:MAG: helix-turn-helix transcriptional regulator [Lachnospiraceae bacterium]|nr:helix-turn-helix transcriptional regulator [Lachnospiraceae bacterium]